MEQQSYTAAEIAAALGASKRAMNKRIEKEHWQHESGSNGARRFTLQSLPPEIRARLLLTAASRPVQPAPDIDDFDRQPEWKKEEALRWLAIIERCEAYVQKAHRRSRAIKNFARIHRIEHPEEKQFSYQTLYRKLRAYRDQGIDGLITGVGSSAPYAAWPEEAKAYLFQLFCNRNQPTASWCIGQLRLEARNKGWHLPSTRTMHRHILNVNQETRDYYRRGVKYWREHYLPSVLRDYDEMDPAELYVSDHKQINVAVRHPSGRVLFPWITAWKDMRSRKILGWTAADIPSGDTINLSLKYSIEKYGASEHVVIDNGRDFSAKHFTGGQEKRFRFKVKEDEITGLYKLLNITPHFCIPANAQAKNIERWFWTLEQNFEKAFPTYRGNNIMNRPEGVDDDIKKGRGVMGWEEFVSCMENYIESYNQDHEHQGHGMNGRTPNQVWNEYFEGHAQRRVSPASLRLLMMKSGKPQKVGRFGITAFGGNYRSDELMDHQSELVFYRYDPADLSILYIYARAGEYLCTAGRTYRTAWNDEEAYHEIRRIEKKKKRAIKEQRAAAEELADVEFGYRKQEPSGEHPDKPANVIRVIRTQLDGVDKRIERDAEAQDRAVNDGGMTLERFREEYGQMMSARLEERKRKSAQKATVFKLNMPGIK